ncbi:hypothetical protein D3C81_606910 [compost metagenome]
MEGHATGERARHHQQLEQAHRPLAQVEAGGPVEHLGGSGRVLRQANSLGRPGAGDGHPRHEHIEHPDADHRDQCRQRDDLFRVARLLAIHRRGLEADPGPEREEQAYAGIRANHPFGRFERIQRVDRRRRHALRATAMQQHGKGHQPQHQDLQHQAQPEHLGGQGNIKVAEHAIGQQHGQGEHDPGHVHAEDAGQQVFAEEGEDAHQRRFEDDVGERDRNP